ncbi:MAG: glycosyltransferase family 2 protein [Alphaproteobacteria bacterium]
MSQPLVSVIIPIYKVEEFLPDCLESVIHQTYSDLEIICVNDGSPDRCEDILKDYAMLDRRIKVINKVNGGLSSARNAALPVAQGEYVFFLDSDDWLSLDCIENLVKDMLRSKADIACVHDILSYYQPRRIDRQRMLSGMSPALLKLPTKSLNNCGWWPGESFTAARRCLIWG